MTLLLPISEVKGKILAIAPELLHYIYISWFVSKICMVSELLLLVRFFILNIQSIKHVQGLFTEQNSSHEQ
jgi:hypothetical protein